MSQLKNSLVLNSVASFPFIFPASKAKKLISNLQFPCDLTQSVHSLHHSWKHVQKLCGFYILVWSPNFIISGPKLYLLYSLKARPSKIS